MYSTFSNGNIFTDVKVEKFPRHLFDKSFITSFTANHGLLYPHFVKDVIPGDRIDVHTFGRVQLQPLATASMQNIRAYMRYFYIPYRLIWDKWDEFISQDGFVQTPILAPYVELVGNQINKISDPRSLLHYLGVRTFNQISSTENGIIQESFNDTSKLAFTLFRLFSYYLVWDCYFRDENLQNKVMDRFDITEGDNTAMFVSNNINFFNQFLPISYEKDYFTTALPWQQKGQPVNLSAFVSSQFSLPVSFSADNITYGNETGLAPTIYSLPGKLRMRRPVGSVTEDLRFSEFIFDTNSTQFINEPDFYVDADMGAKTIIPGETLSTSFNINDLRYSNAMQRYLERLALGGNRPAEFYLSMYGVKIDDLRIGQPLYLGGGYEYVHVTPVTQQSETATTPQGNLAGNGSASPNFGFNNPYTADEFGVILGVFYLRPEIHYTQGVDRELQLFSHLDYYNPIFAHLGEEAVKKSELIFTNGMVNREDNPDYNDPTFGYQSRYAYLKHCRNEVHGELVSTLSHWLLSTHFNGTVELNSDFITVDQNYDIFATIDENKSDHYICEFHHDFKVESSMPDFSIPSL